MNTFKSLTPEQVIDRSYEECRELFDSATLREFHEKVFLTHLLEYEDKKQEFDCEGFLFSTQSEHIEIIATAKRVVRGSFGIQYGLRWCSCGRVEDLAEFRLEDYVGYKNERRWLLAKPFESQLLALGRHVPSEFLINNESHTSPDKELFSEQVIPHLLNRILAEKILRS